MPLAKRVQQGIKIEMEYLNKMIEKRRKDLQNLNSEISQARINLKEFITMYFGGLISQISGTSLETFNDFAIREIGDKGINIETRIQNAFERETQGVLNEIAKIWTSFDADLSSFEKHAGTLGKIGINFLNQSGFINVTNIKLAENLNKALPLIGIAFELWDSYNKYQKEQGLEKAKEEMKSYFEGQKKEILDLISDETKFKQTCFLGALELEKSFQEVEEKIKKTQECDQEFEKWIQMGEAFKTGGDFIEVEPEKE